MVARPRRISVSSTVIEFLNFDKDRTSTLVKNIGTGDIFLGVDATVGTGDGFELSAGQAISFAPIFGDDSRIARFAISVGAETLSISEEHLPKRNDEDRAAAAES